MVHCSNEAAIARAIAIMKRTDIRAMTREELGAGNTNRVAITARAFETLSPNGKSHLLRLRIAHRLHNTRHL